MTPHKDRWDLMKIVDEITVACAALWFTASYQQKQSSVISGGLEVARTNSEIGRRALEAALLPAALSIDAKQRSMALYIAEALDVDFALKLAAVLSADANGRVRSESHGSGPIISRQ